MNREMSAIGTKRTLRVALHMSAFGGKADIATPLGVRADNARGQTLNLAKFLHFEAISAISVIYSRSSRILPVQTAKKIRGIKKRYPHPDNWPIKF